jgi:hypothetical protein
MHIHSLTLTAFKHITTPTTYNLDHAIAVITGDNATGKTTIRDAIIWILYGTTPSGSNRTASYLPQSQPTTLDASCVITGRDGVPHTFHRHNRTLTCDNIPLNASEVDDLIGPREIFLSTFLPETFLTLAEAEARKLLMHLLPTISPQDVLNALDSDEERRLLTTLPPAFFHDLTKKMQSLRQSLKLAQKDQDQAQGALNALTDHPLTAPDPVPAPDRTAFDAAQTAWRDAQSQRDILSQQITAAEQQLAQLQRQTPQIDPVTFKHLQEQERAWREADSQCRSQRAAWLAQKPAAPQTTGMCPTCGQRITPDHAQTVLHAYTRALHDWQAQESGLRQAEDVVHQQQHAWQNAVKQAEESAQWAHRAQILQMQKNLADLRTQQAALPTLDDLRHRAQETEAAYQEASRRFTAYQAAQRHYEDWTAQQQQAAARLAATQQQQAELVRQITACQHYQKTAMTLQTAPLLHHLQDTECVLWTIPQKEEDDPQATFKILYHGRPLLACSTAERMRAAVEWHNALNALTGADIPLFLDNGESLSVLPAVTSQVLVARVHAQTPLTVTGVNRHALV